MNETLELIKKRKSIRVYKNKEISKKNKRLILEAAINAPSAGNMQLYSIIDVTDQKIKDKLSITCDNQPFIKEGKMVLVFVADYTKWVNAFKYANAKPRKLKAGDLWLALSDANIAAQTCALAAESLGIGSCFIGDIIENHDEVKKVLNLSDNVVPACMLVFGYPTKQQMERQKPQRVDLKYTIFENKYRQLNEDESKKMLINKAPKGMYEDWMKAFCERKYNSLFCKEMNDSFIKYLKDFK